MNKALCIMGIIGVSLFGGSVVYAHPWYHETQSELESNQNVSQHHEVLYEQHHNETTCPCGASNCTQKETHTYQHNQANCTNMNQSQGHHRAHRNHH